MRSAALDRAMLVPPELRALARVVSDVDYTQFPELYPPDGRGEPPAKALSHVLAEITGAPLTAREMWLFRSVFMEVRHRLRGVDASMMTDSPVGGAIALTIRIDTACTELDVPLARVFPNIKEAHNFFLEILSLKFSVEQAPVFYRLSDALCELLLHALEELMRYKEILAVRGNGMNAAGYSVSTASMSLTNTETLQKLSISELTHSLNYDEFLWSRDALILPADIECAFAGIDGDIALHMAHLRWYVEALRQSIFFDDAVYLCDNSVRKLWHSYVGKGVPACFTEVFQPVLQIFPEWSREPIMDVLDYKRCGVVSLYSLRRLLSIWGPFILIDRNMREDMRSGYFNLTQSLEYHKKAFVRRPDAAAGDYVLTLVAEPGEVAALCLYAPAGARPGARLTARTVTFTRQTGAWKAETLTDEEFDEIHDACGAFSELFCRPCGTVYKMPESPKDRAHAANASTSSSLHRACFRNNARYVRTLLERGSGIIVNTGAVDPVISEHFCWTPLICAVNNPNSDPEDVVRMLIEAGADVHTCDGARCTALYYAIANGYVGATQALLQHSPQLRTSDSSEPLLVALGAHHFHARESDIRRLSDLIPSAEMIKVLTRYQTNLSLARLAVDIIQGKLQGVERLPTESDDPALWHPDGEVELRTPDDDIYLARLISYHGALCRNFREDVVLAANVLYHHCYYLSCREHFRPKQICATEICMATS